MNNKDIGRRLKEIRTAKGLTQKKMSEILGIDQSAYNRIENGENAIAVRHCITLRKEFGISLDALIFGVEVDDEPEIVKLAWELAKGNPVSMYQVIAFIYEKKAEMAQDEKEHKRRAEK